MEVLVHHVSYSDVVFVFEDAEGRWQMCRCRGETLDEVCLKVRNEITRQARPLQVVFKLRDGRSTYMAAGFDLSGILDLNLDSSCFRGSRRTVGCTLKGICFPIFSLAIDKWLEVIQKTKGGCEDLKVYFLSGAHQKLTNGGETYSTQAAAGLLMRWTRYRLALDFNMPEYPAPIEVNVSESISVPEGVPERSDVPDALKTLLSKELSFLNDQSARESVSDEHMSSRSTFHCLVARQDSTKSIIRPTDVLGNRQIRIRNTNVSIVVVHSGEGVFRYDENVKFVNSELLPKMDADRSNCQQRYGDDWEQAFSVTLTLAEGAPARMSAISQGLQFMRPNYIHILRPKSFNSEPMLREDGVQFLSFAQVSTVAPISIGSRCFTGEDQLDSWIRLTVNEMINHKESFERSLEQENEMSQFWLRKTHKPVLAVIMVQKKNQTVPTFFRGVNLEVSMPTGSLCAERNCIGTALAYDPLICRSDLKLVAVLSIPAVGGVPSSPHVVTKMRIPIASPPPLDIGPRQVDIVSASMFTPLYRVGSVMLLQLGLLLQSLALDPQRRKDTRETPFLRATRLNKTLNPIEPCGACNEWLKKITEVQPLFRVINFTDVTCTEIFVKRVR
eukprot:GEMP01016975.1.p1 GENE.GEMP01016975.1~~GEMP01016975.1.p1  ORF type:complete len:615 (+),score=74.62 GEMP01016975.1:273-2117(+)